MGLKGQCVPVSPAVQNKDSPAAGLSVPLGSC